MNYMSGTITEAIDMFTELITLDDKPIDKSIEEYRNNLLAEIQENLLKELNSLDDIIRLTDLSGTNVIEHAELMRHSIVECIEIMEDVITMEKEPIFNVEEMFNSTLRSFFIPANSVGDPNSVAEFDSALSDSSNPGEEKKDSWDGSSWRL